MAKKTTFTVTHPDGTVSKRTSTSRNYTHAVVQEIFREHDVQRALDQAEMYRKTAEKYEAAQSGEFTLTRKPWNFGGETGRVRITAEIGGTYVGSWMEKDGEPERPEWDKVIDREAGLVELRKYAENARDIEAQYREQAERAAQGPAVRYDVPRWSSREDLAWKAAQGEFASTNQYVKVTVQAVDQA